MQGHGITVAALERCSVLKPRVIIRYLYFDILNQMWVSSLRNFIRVSPGEPDPNLDYKNKRNYVTAMRVCTLTR